MPIVSNTSPVLNLAIVNHLSLMYEQFGEILIPQAVFEELRVEEGLPGSQSLREAIEKGWLEVKEAKDQIFVKALRADLDKGEAEAIALALQVKSEYVILDEREGRRVAKLLGLTNLLSAPCSQLCPPSPESLSKRLSVVEYGSLDCGL